ncbi:MULTISPECIES: pyrimidine utilization protein A [unclassified Rhizobium]|uniref:pyrimidine utilization protein A n=1 Tax=unclassified Rhizobium TaxID=2613769 RepID=UPI00178295CB|nr:MULTISPECIES: pyrimidine utilization protein A [unclassified Rhizobium]MBD8688590.1 pyrimidine utilization protein A [Rhizobium sp. CFBP 13644]MBD8692908.1 pyrimidine utilization protein A [Rhizobium sp. CFBP 13717]
MEIGVFIPIGNNGWLLSENAPQYKPSFELNKQITLAAEKYGFDFALSMIKLRGFGGKTEFWDYNLESFTLMAGLAAVTSKIKLFGTTATLVMPPAIVARMATTIDSISGGRFGINLVTGWQRPEYSQMGLWPGDDYFGDRYEYLSEYSTVLKDLLSTGQSDLKGKYFTMDDCRMKPVPEGDVKLICAGSSDKGMEFSAKFADYSFCFGVGVNTPKAFAATNERLLAATQKTGRDVRSFVLTMVLAEEKSEDAWAKWEHYKAGADQEAIKWLGLQSSADKKSGADTNVRHMSNPVSAVNINMGTIIGSYEEVAAMLDEMSEVPGTGGVMLTFDDFVEGIEKFGRFVQPLMKSRKHVCDALEAAE